MLVSDSLKVIAVRSRWAYEELVYAEKMVEWNRLYSDRNGTLFSYLKEHHGSRWGAVKALRAMLREAGRAVPQIDHKDKDAVKAERRRIVREQWWALEELSYKDKKQEAVALFETVGAMFQYLTSVYGNPKCVLEMLTWLKHTQSGRLKTLCLD